MQPDAAESRPRRLPHALQSRIWTLPRAPPAGMVRTASCRATPRWIHGVPLHTRSAGKLLRRIQHSACQKKRELSFEVSLQ